MAHVHFDNTEDETHAALLHDCEPGECPAKANRGSAGKGRVGAGARPARQDTKAFREERHQLAGLAPEQVGEETATSRPEDVEIVRRGSRRSSVCGSTAAGTRTLDLDAGIRAYMGPRGAKRFWHGYYSGKAIDHFTGGVIPIVDSASRQEYDLFEDHYDLVRGLLGEAPETAIGDKGFSVETVFRKCTTNGTAPVFPWRPGGGDFKRHDKDTHDRHGVPRCKHCGAPTGFVRFSQGNASKLRDERSPRLWVQCMAGATDECTKTQTIACSSDYRLLVPLWRTDPLYHELKESHSSYKAQHDWWRDRYKVAADGLGVRPKIRDIGWHRLRANAAALVDWLRICYREGWLGKSRRNHLRTERKFKDRAASINIKLAKMRVRMGIMAAHGDKAEQLGLGKRTPPSRRDRGAPGA